MLSSYGTARRATVPAISQQPFWQAANLRTYNLLLASCRRHHFTVYGLTEEVKTREERIRREEEESGVTGRDTYA